MPLPSPLLGDRRSRSKTWVKIDRRPWKLKGLAKVYYQQNGNTKKASIDDLRFKGADAILERIQANFTGEILDLEEEAQPNPRTYCTGNFIQRTPKDSLSEQAITALPAALKFGFQLLDIPYHPSTWICRAPAASLDLAISVGELVSFIMRS